MFKMLAILHDITISSPALSPSSTKAKLDPTNGPSVTLTKPRESLIT